MGIKWNGTSDNVSGLSPEVRRTITSATRREAQAKKAENQNENKAKNIDGNGRRR